MRNFPAYRARSYVRTRRYVSRAKASGGPDVIPFTDNFDNTVSSIVFGRWAQGGQTTGIDWKDPQSAGGLCFASGVNTGYDDSIALLSGFGANHRISGTIYYDGSTRTSSTDSHEVELILRGSYTPNNQQIYECNIGYSGASGGWYSQIVLLQGTIGNFTPIHTDVNTLPTPQTGDVFMAEVIGTTINTYLNGLLIRTASASAIASGQPGVGFFVRPLHGSEALNDFAFSSITADAA